MGGVSECNDGGIVTRRTLYQKQHSCSLLSLQFMAGWADQVLLRAFLTRPPKRAKTRFSPKRAHSDRVRSASKEAGRPPPLPLTATPTKSFQLSSSPSPNSWRDGRGETSGARVGQFICSFQACSFPARDGG